MRPMFFNSADAIRLSCTCSSGRRLLFLPPAEPVAEWLALLRIGTGATVSGGVLLVAGAGKGHRLSVRQVTFIEGHQSGGSSVAAGHRVSQSADDAIQEDVCHCLGLLAARLLVAAIRVEGVVAKGRQQAKVVAHLLTAVTLTNDVAQLSTLALKVLSNKATRLSAQTVSHHGEVIWREIIINPNQLSNVAGDDRAHHLRVGHRLRVQRHLSFYNCTPDGKTN
ncbi:hypothetical protein TYRP_001328 [Tyrophagus putrescentiae]|nr:hypothetical protein TYRP_001328 [Tyrophagus putrescentiae]